MPPIYHLEIKGQHEHTVRFRLKKDDAYLSFDEVFTLWEQSGEFVAFYIGELIKLDYKAFYWEHPAVNKEFLSKKYECILQRSKPLEHLSSNKEAFKDYLLSETEVTDFMNLGKNARLVIPIKKSDEEIYNHIGKFIRMADTRQILALFKRVGRVVKEEIEAQKLIWLNTAGLGVIWLHVRMDTRPKYYKTKRYKDPDFLNVIK